MSYTDRNCSIRVQCVCHMNDCNIQLNNNMSATRNGPRYMAGTGAIVTSPISGEFSRPPLQLHIANIACLKMFYHPLKFRPSVRTHPVLPYFRNIYSNGTKNRTRIKHLKIVYRLVYFKPHILSTCGYTR